MLSAGILGDGKVFMAYRYHWKVGGCHQVTNTHEDTLCEDTFLGIVHGPVSRTGAATAPLSFDVLWRPQNHHWQQNRHCSPQGNFSGSSPSLDVGEDHAGGVLFLENCRN